MKRLAVGTKFQPSVALIFIASSRRNDSARVDLVISDGAESKVQTAL